MCGCCWKALSKKVGLSNNDIWITIWDRAWPLSVCFKIKFLNIMGISVGMTAYLYTWREKNFFFSWYFWYLQELDFQWSLWVPSNYGYFVVLKNDVPVLSWWCSCLSHKHCSLGSRFYWSFPGDCSAIVYIFVKTLLVSLCYYSQPASWDTG